LYPVAEWLDDLFWLENEYGEKYANVEVLKAMQLVMRLENPLDWSSGFNAVDSVRKRMAADREFALDVLDFFVQKVATPSYADRLEAILTLGGSEWEVARLTEDKRHLAKRVVGPVRDVIDAIPKGSERARVHLDTAWGKLVGRHPDPSAAYREAIRAVESAAKPVVTPQDPTATLGKIIQALRDKPQKWRVALDKSSPDQIADMADLVWKGQLDRHGTDDPSAPLNVSQQEADAAVHIAIALVRLFTGEGIRVA
jgi:hypothetical protein